MYIFIVSILIAFFMGIFLSLPVGPVGAFCVKETLNHGYRSGMAAGFGAAVGDFFFTLCALGGAFFIDDIPGWIKTSLIFFAGIALILNAIFSHRDLSKQIEKKTEKSVITSFFSALTLTLSNPFLILFISAVFSFFNINEVLGIYLLIYPIAVFLGAFCWWLFFVPVLVVFHNRFDPKFQTKIKKISFLILFIFGVFIIVKNMYSICFYNC